jgi:glyoxylase I family protein
VTPSTLRTVETDSAPEDETTRDDHRCLARRSTMTASPPSFDTSTATPPLVTVDHVSFTVRDLDASVAWYRKVFNGTVVEFDFPHYGREWTGYARLVIEPQTGTTIGLHHNDLNEGEEFNELRTGLDHLSFRVNGLADLEAWVRWLDSLEIAHSGIQRKSDPSPFSTVVFRDIDNIQLEVVAQE